MTHNMKERPILFSEDQVRAILEGRMTQTRRVVKPQPDWKFRWCRVNQVGPWFHIEADVPEKVMHTVQCPYGTPGDRLWVRETWQALRFSYDRETGCCDDWSETDPESVRKHRGSGKFDLYHNATCGIAYGAEHPIECREDRGFRWRPSIHMPRWASRLTLEIVSVRVERLREISESDAESEGVEPMAFGEGWHWKNYLFKPEEKRRGAERNDVKCCRLAYGTARESFASLWESINGPGSWEANPWVWVVEFKRVL